MNAISSTDATPAADRVESASVRQRPMQIVGSLRTPQVILWLGLAAFAIPTMIDVARISWSSEQGAHGPIVLATGLWLLFRQAGEARRRARPGSPVVAGVLLALLLPLYVVARVTGIVEIEGYVMYAALVVVAYALVGTAALKAIWFPLVYFLFLFPPPDTLFAMITQPLKIAISEWVIALLHLAGYPIAGSGVTIQIGQYQLLVAAACAGMNSLISLSAIGLFYTYILHSSNWRYMALMMLVIVPVAILANLIRVMLLILITYHFGEAAGQGFFHGLAGMVMFLSALLLIFLIDKLASPLRRRLARAGDEA